MSVFVDADLAWLEQKILCMGMDAATRFGLRAAYMRAMNRGGSGGYTAAHFKDARYRDHVYRNMSALTLLSRRKHVHAAHIAAVLRAIAQDQPLPPVPAYD